jgi:hypothetical protein
MWNLVTAKLINNFISYLTKNTVCCHLEEESVKAVWGSEWLFCCENYTDRTKTICGQNLMICQNVMTCESAKYHSHVTVDGRSIELHLVLMLRY